MSRPTFTLAPFVALMALSACSDDAPDTANPGTAGSAGTPATSGAAGMASSGAAGIGGGSAGASAGAGVGGISGGGGGAGGTVAGTAGTGGTSGAAGTLGGGGSVNHVPADYQGTPFKELSIPGRINSCDYDRGGAGVAWCHDPGNCGAGTVTGDYPSGSPPYRPPVPPSAKLCSGAACDDNVGVCRMNPDKPDNTINGQPMPAEDTYLCYSVVGEWTKYTVTVAEAGAYAVSGVIAVMQNGGVNLSFGDDITTGDIALANTPNANSGSGENYHSWEDRKGLGMVTFPSAGKYVMTLKQVGRFNSDSFTFTKM
jgi:hypothetical protein